MDSKLLLLHKKKNIIGNSQKSFLPLQFPCTRCCEISITINNNFKAAFNGKKLSYFKSLRTKYYYWVSSGGALRYSIPNMLYFKELFTYTRAYGLIFFVYNRFMSLFLLLITALLSRTRRKIFYFNNDTYSGNHTCLARSFDVQLFWSFYYYFKNGAVVYCHIIIIFTFNTY